MVNYMCTMPPNVQRMVSEALSLISKHDFPAQWTELLPELVSKFTLDDFHVTNGKGAREYNSLGDKERDHGYARRLRTLFPPMQASWRRRTAS
jgi:hypothetical protein